MNESTQENTEQDQLAQVWSYVNTSSGARPKAQNPGRYSRPAAIRDFVIAGAFGRELKRLRELKQLSTRELAVKVGVSQPFITQLETTRLKNIMLHQVFDFAEALDVAPLHFVAICQLATKRFEHYLAKYPGRRKRERVPDQEEAK